MPRNEIQQVMFDLKTRSLKYLDEPPKAVVSAVLEALQPSPAALENLPNETSLKRSVYSWRKRSKAQSNPEESPRRTILKVKIKGKSKVPDVSDVLLTPKENLENASLPSLSPLARELTMGTPNSSKSNNREV